MRKMYFIYDVNRNCYGCGYAYQLSGMLEVLERRYPHRQFIVR